MSTEKLIQKAVEGMKARGKLGGFGKAMSNKKKVSRKRISK